ncbi:MAG: SUMF1/EgtB/PvdO family nonheme iron enzyme, partial [Lewinella sp.]|nr:SUMF1/EgtB/PvdO family nonheme iron enzyme [Lewinella sp.]
ARSRTANDEWAGTSSNSDLPLYANYDSDLLDGFAVTAPVGTFKPNGLGLFDMSGNADEWCWDWLSEGYYHQSPRQNPRGPESGTERIFRGGSYEYDERHCRITTRDWDLPLVLDDFYGIRLARNVE